MNEPIEITKGSTYIFLGKKAMTRNEYSKFKILEVTDTTYLIKNIDADRTFRRGIVDFNYDYKPVEVIESNWISTKDKLPQEGKYVLARHNRGTWHDSDDQANVNCVVVKLVKGLSEKDRQLMKDGKLPSTKEGGIHYDGSWDKPIHAENERYNIYKGEDEHGNNLVPYKWEMFGPDSFFGQTITQWMPIEPLK